MSNAFRWLVAAVCLVFLVALAPSAHAATPPGVVVQGNALVTSAGAQLRMTGANRSGSEYACAQGWGFFDGPTSQASISAMTAWGINAVRVPLNEDCWLGVNGVNPAYAGANYQSAIRAYVDALLSNGLDVILDLHWGAPGTQLATSQEQAPDADHAPAFWSSVAAQYRGVNGIAYDLFNEPHDISWACWLRGCTTPAGWQATGEQQLIDAVRGAGANQPVIVEGLNWGGDLSGWMANRPTDPAGQLVAGWHIYNFSYCSSMSCWNNTVAPVAQQVPVLATEVGENDCGGGFLNTLLPWVDSHRIGFLAWAWDSGSCTGGPSLVSDYSGTPTGYGAAYKAYLGSSATAPTSAPSTTTTSATTTSATTTSATTTSSTSATTTSSTSATTTSTTTTTPSSAPGTSAPPDPGLEHRRRHRARHHHQPRPTRTPGRREHRLDRTAHPRRRGVMISRLQPNGTRAGTPPSNRAPARLRVNYATPSRARPLA